MKLLLFLLFVILRINCSVFTSLSQKYYCQEGKMDVHCYFFLFLISLYHQPWLICYKSNHNQVILKHISLSLYYHPISQNRFLPLLPTNYKLFICVLICKNRYNLIQTGIFNLKATYYLVQSMLSLSIKDTLPCLFDKCRTLV